MTRWKAPVLAATLIVLGAIVLVGPTARPVVAQTKAAAPRGGRAAAPATKKH